MPTQTEWCILVRCRSREHAEAILADLIPEWRRLAVIVHIRDIVDDAELTRFWARKVRRKIGFWGRIRQCALAVRFWTYNFVPILRKQVGPVSWPLAWHAAYIVVAGAGQTKEDSYPSGGHDAIERDMDKVSLGYNPDQPPPAAEAATDEGDVHV